MPKSKKLIAVFMAVVMAISVVPRATITADSGIGYIRGGSNIEIGDALEILKYLANMKSLIVPNSNAWKAALITPASKKAGKPAIGDALEIFKYLANMKNLIGSSDYTNSVRQEFYRLINNHRKANGLRALKVNSALQDYADVRSEELRVVFGHTRPDGSAAGSGWYNSQNFMNTRFAENALGVHVLDKNPKAAANYIFIRWRDSPGHNAHYLYKFDSNITMALGIAPKTELDGTITSGAIFATGY